MRFERRLTLSAEDRQQLLGWGKEAGWGQDVFDTEALGLIWRPKQSQLVLYDDEVPLSKCGLLQQSLVAGEEQLRVGGIGGVVTPPHLRGKGFARQVLREALRIFRDEWQLDAGMLFCRETLVPFYRKAGWQVLSADVQILQANGLQPCPVPIMVYPLSRAWPAGPVVIDSLPW